MTSSDLFAFGVSSLRLQAQPSQVELAEVLSDIPPFKWSASPRDVLASQESEQVQEGHLHVNTRPNRKTD